MRVDRRGRRQDLVVGSAHEHLAADAAAYRAARDWDDVANAALALAHSLRGTERDVLRDQYLALLLARALAAVVPRLRRNFRWLGNRDGAAGVDRDGRNVIDVQAQGLRRRIQFAPGDEPA